MAGHEVRVNVSEGLSLLVSKAALLILYSLYM